MTVRIAAETPNYKPTQIRSIDLAQYNTSRPHTCAAEVRSDTGAGRTIAVIWAAAATMMETASLIWGSRWDAWWAGVKGSSREGSLSCDWVHDWSILSTPSDMILDRVRRREMVSGVSIIERNDESGETLFSSCWYIFFHRLGCTYVHKKYLSGANSEWVISKNVSW